MAKYNATGNFTVFAGEVLTVAGDSGLRVTQGSVPQRITVDGELAVTAGAQSVYGIDFEDAFGSNSMAVISATGIVRVTSQGAAVGVTGPFVPPSIINQGLIEVSGVTSATGVSYAGGFSALFENRGTIRATSDGAASGWANTSSATGVVTNAGTIEARGGASAVGLSISGLSQVTAAPSGFLNTGVILASDRNAARASTGVAITGGFTNAAGPVLLIENRGRIEGEVALFVSASTHFNRLVGGTQILNSGVLAGDVQLSSGPFDVTNTGTITGAVQLSGLNDTFDGRSGRLGGALSAGAGNDSVAAGVDNDSLSGEAGDDTLLGGDGDDLLLGGGGTDRLDGGGGIDSTSYASAEAGVILDLKAGTASSSLGLDQLVSIERAAGGVWGDLLAGSDGADTLSGNSGHDTLQGRDGADDLRGDNGDDILDGGGDNDTLTGGAGADTFRFALGGGRDRITDFNAAAGDRVELAVGSTYTAFQDGADTVVDVGGGNALRLSGVQLATLPASWISVGPSSVPKPAPTPQLVATIKPPGAYVLPEDTSLRTQDQTGILLGSPGVSTDTVAIGGRLETTQTVGGGGLSQSLSGIGLEPYGGGAAAVTVAGSGVVRVDTTAAFMNAVGANLSGNGPPQLTNHGLIEAVALRDATGVYQSRSGSTPDVINDGVIHAVSSQGSALGVSLPISGWLTNAGLIDVAGGTSALGVSFQQGSDGFMNTGTIRATASGGASVAVQFEGGFLRSIVNAGTLQGAIALRITQNGTSSTFEDSFVSTITNTGRMVGRVELGFQKQILVNSGSIEGDVDLGGSNDIYDGRFGRATGLVSGGDGADSLAGGAAFDNLQGNAGTDTESGGDGDDFVVGGKDADTLSGDSGNDLVYGNLGADTCDGGSGDDIVRGGQDNDVCLGGAGDDFVSGDKGDDTMTGGSGADIFHTFGDAGLDRVTDFSLAQGDRVQLDPGTVFTVSQVGADTVINMTGGGQMILVGVSMSMLTPGWIFGA